MSSRNGSIGNPRFEDQHRGGVDQMATVSAGVAAIVPGEKVKTCADLLNAADQALTRQKPRGAICVVPPNSAM